ncbi:TetR/AcrR family transcriptional regulator [Nocardia cyriacigeorgica]|uniref:TetR/AcrR family transcriptional regulator n=1 Tax=Nocardia cyriacigeorgica TaxID=135487 RepID=UPI0018961913|nr:TetR/AcrR family transcriptional regulator [Nocardia cyriacigeorgica]MBF6398720.1 TetR/AcrR family transcriptional regulator [Nocardia cyriacigeorgica]MBF6403766.1 TetR/AcrR family transcriptional regulator [Nocardia cyriacigeorgica]
MGNREDLLRGARRCLAERGWANSTVRDIAAASGGVSHAAIFYHFGSREALLTAALVESIEERLATFQEAIAQSTATDTATQFRMLWDQFADSFDSERGVWLAHFEAVLQAQHSDLLRRRLTDNQLAGRKGGVAWLTGVEPGDGDPVVRSVGSVYLALIAGVAWQYLVDPETAPRPADIVDGVRALAALVDDRAGA